MRKQMIGKSADFPDVRKFSASLRKATFVVTQRAHALHAFAIAHSAALRLFFTLERRPRHQIKRVSGTPFMTLSAALLALKCAAVFYFSA